MKILIIGKVWPEPKSSAAGRRMEQLIHLFQNRGEVHFACANTFTGNEINLAEIDVTIQHIHLNDDSVNDYFKKLDPDIVIFDRFLTEEQYGWRIIENCPNSIRILNTEDLHFLRKTRQKFVKETNQIANDTSILDFHNDETMRELASIYRSDLTIMISPEEVKLLQQEMQVPSDLLTYLPIFCEPQQYQEKSISDRKDFLFIGNMLHEPNVDAVKILVDQCWPLIQQKCKNANLIIAGAYPTQQILQLNNPQKNIKVVGHHNDLEELYKTIRISLIPLRFGAGIKGKVLESLEFGVPFVSTSIGTEGLFFNENWEECVSNNWVDFSEKAISLYDDNMKWHKLQKLGEDHLKNYFLQSKFELSFLSEIDYLSTNIQSIRKKRYFAQLIQHHSLMSTKYLSKWIMEKNKNL